MNMRSFIDKRLYRIRGFMHPSDAMLFSGILEYQKRHGWSGALAEIGVFYGRSLTLMAKGAGVREPVIGMDLFDIAGQKDYVAKVLKQEHPETNVELVSGSSLDTKPSDILDRAGPVRFFSVDGGHELHHIKSDAALALDTLSDYGIIAFDDFMNAQYPDLSLGIMRFLEAHRAELRPFALTKSKLYVCRAGSYADYLACARDLDLWAGAHRAEFDFLDTKVVFVEQSILRRGLYQEMASRGFGALVPERARGRRSARG